MGPTLCVKILSCPTIALDNKVPNETSYLLPCLKVGMHCHCARLIFISVFGGYTDQSWIISSLITVSSRDIVSTFHLCDCENLLLLNFKLRESKVTNETSSLLPLFKLASKVDIYISFPALISIAAKDIVSTFDQGSCGSNIIPLCVKIFSCPIIVLDNKVPKETSYLLPGLKVGMHCHRARLIFI